MALVSGLRVLSKVSCKFLGVDIGVGVVERKVEEGGLKAGKGRLS